MRAWGLVVWFGSLAVCGCQRQSQPTVVLDNWWTVDFARSGCQRQNACGFDKENPAGVQDYINSLKAQFAAASICRGVTVLDFRGPGQKNPETPNYSEKLIIDYSPNKASQTFSIMGQPSSNIFATGTIQQIVERACIAARGLGARVE